MAAKKSGFGGALLPIAAGLVVLYLVYRFFIAPRGVQAATGAGGIYGGGYSGGGYPSGYNPYTGAYNGASSSSGLIALLNKLLGGGKTSGSSAKGGAPGTSAGVPSGSSSANYSALQNQIAAIGGFNRDAINTPNFADLGGQTLANYVPDYSLPTQLSYLPDNYQFDVSQSALPSFDLSGVQIGGYDPSQPLGGFADVTASDPGLADYTIGG